MTAGRHPADVRRFISPLIDFLGTRLSDGMSRAKKATEHAMILVTAQVIGMAAGIATILIAVRVMSKAELAIIPVVQMLATLCYKLFAFGLDLEIQRKMPGLVEADRLAGYELSRAFTAIMGGGTVLFCFGLYFGSRFLAKSVLNDTERAGEILLMIPTIISFVVFMIAEQILKGKGDFAKISFIAIVVPILNLPCTILGYLIWGVKGLILGLALPRILASLFLVPSLLPYLCGQVSIRKTRRFLADSLPYLAESYLGYVVTYADQWIIGLLMSTETLALYYMPKTLIERIAGLLESINSVLIANMSRVGSYGLQVAKDAFLNARKMNLYAFVPLFLLIIALSYYLIDISMGRDYLEAVWPFALLALASMIAMVYAPHQVAVMTLCRPLTQLYSSAVQGAALLLCLLLFVKPWGVIGVALSYVVARIANVAASTLILQKLIPVVTDRLAYRKILWPSLLMILVCGLGQCVYYRYWTVPFYAALGILLYVMVFLRNLPPADVRLFEMVLPARVLNMLAVFSKSLASQA